MNIRLLEFIPTEKELLQNMLLAYFREIDSSKIIEINQKEVVDYPYLDLYWQEPARKALKLIFDDEVIGFTLLNDHTVSNEAEMSIAEFYIKKEYRRKGIGKKAAFKVFETFSGLNWEVRQLDFNPSATTFWLKVIGEFTNGNFKALGDKTGGQIQLFES